MVLGVGTEIFGSSGDDKDVAAVPATQGGCVLRRSSSVEAPPSASACDGSFCCDWVTAAAASGL